MTLQITRLPSFASAHPGWDHLLQADAKASYFVRPEWLETWWKHFSQGKELLLVLAQESDRPAALALLQIESLGSVWGKRIAFLGSGLSDYGDVLVDETLVERPVAIKAILDALASWYPNLLFDFEQIPETSPTLRIMSDWTRTRAIPCSVLPQDVCPVADLPDTPEAYHQQLKKSFFLDVKRGERRLRERGEVVLIDHVRPADGDWAGLVAELAALQAQRMLTKGESPAWDGPLGPFVRDVLAASDLQGSLRLTGLQFAGRLVAYELCFLHNRTIYAWSRAFDETLRNTGPGKISLLHLIDQGIGEGYQRFDLLRGEEPYKALWTNAVVHNYRVTFLVKPSLRAWLRFKYITAWKRQLQEMALVRKAYAAVKGLRSRRG